MLEPGDGVLDALAGRHWLAFTAARNASVELAKLDKRAHVVDVGVWPVMTVSTPLIAAAAFCR